VSKHTLTLEMLESLVPPLLDPFLKVLKEAKRVEVKVSEYVPDDQLFALNAEQAATSPLGPVPESVMGLVYLIVHPKQEEMAGRVLRELQKTWQPQEPDQ